MTHWAFEPSPVFEGATRVILQTLAYPNRSNASVSRNHVQQTDERRDLDQWPDDANEGFAGVQAEEGYGDGQLELLPAVVNESEADCAQFAPRRFPSRS